MSKAAAKVACGTGRGGLVRGGAASGGRGAGWAEAGRGARSGRPRHGTCSAFELPALRPRTLGLVAHAAHEHVVLHVGIDQVVGAPLDLQAGQQRSGSEAAMSALRATGACLGQAQWCTAEDWRPSIMPRSTSEPATDPSPPPRPTPGAIQHPHPSVTAETKPGRKGKRKWALQPPTLNLMSSSSPVLLKPPGKHSAAAPRKVGTYELRRGGGAAGRAGLSAGVPSLGAAAAVQPLRRECGAGVHGRPVMCRGQRRPAPKENRKTGTQGRSPALPLHQTGPPDGAQIEGGAARVVDAAALVLGVLACE